MDTIVMYPSVGITHILPMVELAKFMEHHHPNSFSTTILVTPHPFANSAATDAALAKLSATTPSITFHHLTSTQSLPSPPPSPQSPSLFFDLALHNNPFLYHTLETIAKTSSTSGGGAIKALIIDFFNTAALDVSATLNIPTYIYFTTSAGALAAVLYMPTLHHTFTKSFKDFDEEFEVEIPGLVPVPKSHLSNSMSDRSSKFYHHFLQLGRQMPKSKGFIVNTFEMLQERALKALSEGKCVESGTTLPIFAVGPLTGGSGYSGGAGNGNGSSNNGSRHECLSWLDSQPSQSVVFVCFGSMGILPAEQLKEMAVGLEKSGQRFLWVVRTPPVEAEDQEEPSLESLLPEGFLERVKDRGHVVRSWAPQFEVLSHDSVGGFVTHCGWNSVLEAVWNGVPMVTWPLFAEQKMNKVFLVADVKLALPLKWSETGFVSAVELEERVRELMDSASGKAIRERVTAMKEGARAALSVGGSSVVALDKLVALWKSGV
ncbi:hypothetical protein Nepgr_020212 [Nepenthes gracilis]|uniref:Glycosyltransferase n=1 Tax=Nepenthes gracilis TaxID=150966 RepID=A0AAD3SWX5_NEPGR|nr:hypothetical protein Nepgr_020212 [Nepenthes gracilis]